MSLKALIVDDEKNGRENLSAAINRHCPQLTVVTEADCVVNAIEAIQQHQPDVVFLDIQMPGGNGFELLEYFNDYPFEVIFVTAFDHYAIKAIRFSAADYLLKPLNVLDLKKAVEKVTERINQKQENNRLQELASNLRMPSHPRIGLPGSDRIEFVPVEKIIRCEGESNYTHIHFSDRGTMLVAKTLVEFEDLLGEYHFVRVHKTHLVNMDYVNTYLKNDGGYLQLSNGDKIAISRRRKDTVLETLK